LYRCNITNNAELGILFGGSMDHAVAHITNMLNTTPEGSSLTNEDGRYFVTTSQGKLAVEGLLRRVGMHDDENEHIDWVEYYLDGEMIHRSAHATLKKFPMGMGVASDFG
jgi:hypothetical protein